MNQRAKEPLEPATYVRVFEQHAEGALILAELERRFSRGPVFEGGIDGVRRSDFNAGARSVVEFIALKINQANGVQDHEIQE